MKTTDPGKIFLSYNSKDKDAVRGIAAALAVAGANVWFDDWVIRPGDSIPGAINQGLAQFNTFVLVWSEGASASSWVRTEMDAAVTRWVSDPAVRLVPVILDETPLPPILAPLKYLDAREGKHVQVARSLLGIDSDAAFRLAVQAFIDEAGLDFREFWGMGVLVACPSCGAPADNIEGWHEVDYENDRSYAGAKCKKCGWSDGSED